MGRTETTAQSAAPDDAARAAENAPEANAAPENAESADLAQYCRERAETYRLFARIIDREVNADTRSLVLAACASLPAKGQTSGAEEEVVEGMRTMGEALSRFDRDIENDLACDYARVFLAAGTYEGVAAVPYESIYTSEEHLLMQDARDQVRAIFRAARVMPNTEENTIPEDFAPFELDYMAVLNDRIADALDAGADYDPVSLAQAQRDFYQAHIANWFGAMLDDVDKVAKQKFYRGFSRALRGFVACEDEDTAALVDACKQAES
jgi:TorA maturation chaperone TorD